MATDPFLFNPVLSSMMKDSNLLAGFININKINSGNPEVEQEILKNVAGYGRQLGRILDVMKILLSRNVLGVLEGSEKEAADKLEELINEIDARKYRMNPTSVTPQNVDQAIRALRKLEPEERSKVLAELNEAFPDDRGG